MIAFDIAGETHLGSTRRLLIPGLLALALLVACVTSPLGRRQLKLMPEDQMTEMGLTAYDQISKETPASTDRALNAYVVCVANAITGALADGDAPLAWEARVFDVDAPNAFALPGGKIGVNRGLLSVAKNQDQLATVIGHEVAHVIAGHSNERISAQYATQGALAVASAVTDPANPTHQQAIALLGAGAQVGVLLPYGRTHESEADLLGLDLMSRAGFDPRQSVELWRNMAAAGGQQPPEFLSTHPSHNTRIEKLEARIPQDLPVYQEARRSGRAPRCS
jgi:predicted Zn-dependent protease